MDGHIVDAEVELTEVEKCVIDVFGADLLLNQIIGDLLLSNIMLAQRLKLGCGPAPILEHLTGCFDKITDNGCTVETGVFCSAS